MVREAYILLCDDEGAGCGATLRIARGGDQREYRCPRCLHGVTPVVDCEGGIEITIYEKEDFLKGVRKNASGAYTVNLRRTPHLDEDTSPSTIPDARATVAVLPEIYEGDDGRRYSPERSCPDCVVYRQVLPRGLETLSRTPAKDMQPLRPGETEAQRASRETFLNLHLWPTPLHGAPLLWRRVQDSRGLRWEIWQEMPDQKRAFAFSLVSDRSGNAEGLPQSHLAVVLGEALHRAFRRDIPQGVLVKVQLLPVDFEPLEPLT